MMKPFLFLMMISMSLFAAETPMTKEEAHQRWLQYSTPAPEHKIISQMAGTWTYETKWIGFPGGKEHTFKGTVKKKMIMGGRFLLSEAHHKTPWKNQDYKDHYLIGYNNLAKRYEVFGADNKGTGMNFSFGEYNPETKTFTFHGTGTNYASKNHESNHRVELKFVDKDTIQASHFQEGRDDGKDFKYTESVLKRKK